MRQVVALALMVGLAPVQEAVAQTRGAGATGKTAIRACSILTRDLVVPFTENTKILDLIPPEEEELGTTGTACEYGAVRLQLYPGRGGKGSMSGKDLQPITGVGQTAYFRNNQDRYAELAVWTATDYLTLQVSVPTGKTAEAIRPGVIGLANAIIAKLK